MWELLESLRVAGVLIVSGGPELWEIAALSLRVSAAATGLAALAAFPLAALLALTPFRGRGAVVTVLNALMGLPSVVVGLIVYLLLSRAGPLGALGLLFTPSAMVIAQTILVAPLMTALARQTLEDALQEFGPYLRSLGAGPWRSAATLLFETRVSLLVALLAGFGRAAAEVGAVMIVGGNIDGLTRSMTTAIALETSKGDLPLALGLGTVLVGIIVAVNMAASLLRRLSVARYG